MPRNQRVPRAFYGPSLGLRNLGQTRRPPPVWNEPLFPPSVCQRSEFCTVCVDDFDQLPSTSGPDFRGNLQVVHGLGFRFSISVLLLAKAADGTFRCVGGPPPIQVARSKSTPIQGPKDRVVVSLLPLCSHRFCGVARSRPDCAPSHPRSAVFLRIEQDESFGRLPRFRRLHETDASDIPARVSH